MATIVSELPPHSLRLASGQAFDAVWSFLNRQPHQATFVLGWIHAHGIGDPSIPADIYLLGPSHDLRGVAFIADGALCYLVGDPADTASAHALASGVARLAEAAQWRLRTVVGVSTVVERFAAFVHDLGLQTAVLQRQRVYRLTARQLRPTRYCNDLQRAHGGQAEVLAEACIAMQAEETGLDVAADVQRHVLRSVIFKTREGRLWARFDEFGRFLFCAGICQSAPHVAQIEGVFVPPEARGCGVARSSLGALCQRLLEEYPLLSLCVNEQNAPAIRVYEALGFVHDGAYATLRLVPASRSSAV